MSKTTISSFNDIVLELKVLAKEKETARRELETTAKRLALKAAQLAVTAKEKEEVRQKLELTAGQLKIKATQLAATAKEKEEARKKLALTAEEKEEVRKELAVTAEELKLKASQLAVIAEEKEDARKKLEVVAEQLKLKDQQLVVTAKEMEAFSYSVSHDLRAPLRAIDGFTQILVDDYADKLDDEGKRITAIIRTSTVQMGHLIDDLLSFSRLGRQEVKKNPVTMGALADEVYKELKKTAPDRNIEFSIGALPDASADVNMMRVVWTNLLSNAIKFTNKKDASKIEVGSTDDSAGTVYYVRDNGAGFDMNYIDKLFGVFQRLHSTEEFEGTGVGLANVKRVIERHGGTVRAEGKVGEGATFYFTLPKT